MVLEKFTNHKVHAKNHALEPQISSCYGQSCFGENNINFCKAEVKGSLIFYHSQGQAEHDPSMSFL